MNSQSRQPPGIPVGGQFSGTAHDEPAVGLGAGTDMLRQLVAEYPELAAVGEAIEVRGGSPSYIVGGTMRDLACDKIPHDLDITSPLRPEEFRRAVSELGWEDGVSVYDIGEKHGTTGIRFKRPDGNVIVIEHTTHRAESYDPASRAPTVVMGTSLEADLARRDFTMNAVAMNLETGEVIDPFGGINDLAAGVIRTPADPERTFSEDPLRIIRAVRFASTKEMSVDDSTAAAARKVADRLDIVSAERIRDEVNKIVAKGPSATVRAMVEADELGVRDRMFRGLGGRIDTTSGPHPLRGLAADGSDTLAVLAHNYRGDGDAYETMKAMKFTNDEIAATKAACAAGDHVRYSVGGWGRSDSDHASDEAYVRQAMRQYGANATARGIRVVRSDLPFSSSRDDATHAALDFVADNADFATRPLPVNGDDAMAAGLKGPAIGKALKAVEADMCAAPGIDRDDALRRLRQLAATWSR